MKKLLIIFLSILALAGGVFAQIDAGQVCPKFGITGPSAIVAPEDTATYTAYVDPTGQDLKLRYQWSVSAGEIASGQGTPAITVKQPKTLLTVTVEIFGLPSGCPNMASEAQSDDRNPQPELLDSFPGPITAKEKARVNEIWDRWEADRNARGVIFLAGTVRQIKANKEMIVSFITKFYKDPIRVTFIDVAAENEMTEFWLVPSGGDEPEPGTKGSKIILTKN